MINRLFAKSWNEVADGPPPDFVFLLGHLQQVVAAADEILDATGAAQLQAFGLNPSKWSMRFRNVVRIAAAIHDLGKANDHFQGMIARDKSRMSRPQGLRHEWISWLIVQTTEIETCLRKSVSESNDAEFDWKIVQWAVVGHHPAFMRDSPPKAVPNGAGSEINVFMGHTDFASCVSWICETFSLEPPPIGSLRDQRITTSDSLRKIRGAFIDYECEWEALRLEKNYSEIAGFIAAVKNCLVASDVAGSALPQDVSDICERRRWISSSFGQVPSKSDFDEIISDRLTDPKTGELRVLRPFQQKVADEAGDVTLVKAGCGSGKTLAAYHWARERYPARRLYICYPTTGTATEGFRDYVFDENALSPKFGARLFHGRAHVDVKLVLHAPEQFGDVEEEDRLTRIESLDAWSTRIVVCTVDTVLGVIQNNRRGLYSWVGFAGAAFVFDEIHSYDANLFSALLCFIRDLRGVPILLMTASLPQPRLERLRREVSNRGRTLVEIGGPEELEKLPRYHRAPEAEQTGLVDRIDYELRRTDRPGKILWVCNTVDRVMSSATECADLESLLPTGPLVYHSRFRYCDRVRQHARVIEAFKGEHPALAICSQVAEMSLDLSATLLITEISPISSLIQRLGRLNRRATQVTEPTMPFIVVTPLNKTGEIAHLPYSIDEMQEAHQWLNELPPEISQRDLVDKWNSMPSSTVQERLNLDGHWIDGGPKREVKELRNPSRGITVLLQSDVDKLQSQPGNLSMAEVLLPMPQPFGFDWRKWPEYRGVPVALDAIVDYRPDRGAEWRRPQVMEANASPKRD